ncbi:tRNA epoxyqueuosine(34) reductase QueG [Paraglaciecola hydrolytica]|uniref:Epoxyqueuosine reductase n=1 Tax=Paraglaciecola hydrolytica TaxID=1799789 RepID=A0A136A508_9ALTE|nr:tRNA epoxyqueuosine(34) reductase QueG [Paraglaciecola hydrolytica]KXI30307.1 tRNA epoxyqueuosine(34) reductase QueG [Paraglaciecola hydrolytica]
MTQLDTQALVLLAENIKAWGKTLGFQQVGICDVDLSQHEGRLQNWLDQGYAGEMHYMSEHGMKRARPAELQPGTLRAISVRMDYLPPDAQFARSLKNKNQAYISRYALGRDYHKLMRARLKQLGEKIKAECGELNYRPFVDSAPVLEHALAEKAGLGWTGKHSLTLNKKAGSWFFLGELLIDLPLPVDAPATEHCGSCTACITICPTQAIVEPYVVDARRCISYLTIEQKGAIPTEFRTLIGNRIYGCDDCQLICPWNRYASITAEADFQPRKDLLAKELVDLFNWDEQTFLKLTEGSAIRRIGYERWQRNLAVGLGNAPYSSEIVDVLIKAKAQASDLVKEHIDWALEQQAIKALAIKAPEPQQRLTERLIRSVEKGLPRDA